MSLLHLQVVTAERVTVDNEFDSVTLPGSEGEMTILPSHAALLATLRPGVLLARSGTDELSLAIGGGFVEVRANNVIVLAESAERADEIDIERAEAARARALQSLKNAESGTADLVATQALQRSLVRLKVAKPKRRTKVEGEL